MLLGPALIDYILWKVRQAVSVLASASACRLGKAVGQSTAES